MAKATAPSPGVELEYIRCAICGADAVRELFWGKDRLVGKPGQFRLVKCLRCSLVYLNPRPTRNALADFYPHEYPPFQAVSHDPVRPHSRVRRWVKAWAVRWYTRGLDFEPPQVRETLARIEDFPPHFTFGFFPTKRHGRLLDVGCGSGLYLHAFQKLGWNAHGVEISARVAEATRRALGLNVITGALEEAKFPDAYFDVVTLIHVLEHLSDPVGTLREVCRILKKDGLVVMAVPNFRSPTALVFRSYWFALDMPRHLCQFSPTSLRALLDKVGGIRLVRVNHLPLTVGFAKSWAYLCQDYPRLGKVLPPRLIARLAPFLAWAVALARLSDSIVVYARKVA